MATKIGLLMCVLILLGSLGAWMATDIHAGEKKKGFAFNKKQYARQWNEVQKKYPLVATAYLEAIDMIVYERDLCPLLRAKYQTPATLRLASLICPEPICIVNVCPRCRLRGPSEADLDAHMQCLTRRHSAQCSRPCEQ